MSVPSNDLQQRADRLIAALVSEASETDAVYLLAVLTNRAATELHRRARGVASSLRGEETWGAWAGLQNAARNLVLQSSTCRDSAASLTGRRR
jgi:hypothetical protein